MPLSDECIFQVPLSAYISPEIAFHGNVKVKVMFPEVLLPTLP